MGRGPSCYYRLLLFLLLLADYLGLSRAAEDHQQQQPPAAALHGSVISEGYDVQDDQQQQEAYDWDLVIVIPSHITEFSRRCAVRDGWARQLRGHEQNNRAGLRTIKLVFTVGAHYPDNSTRDTAMAEMKQFDDIITLPSDFVDRYDALGTKVRLSLREAVDQLGGFRLVLKADTDSYVHVDRLLEFFDKEHMWDGEPVYAGSFRHAPVMWEPENKDHKWFDGKFTQMTGLTQYPWNAQGGGYVISYDLAKYLAHPPLQLKSWTHEDVGVGAWLMSLDYRRIDMPVGFAAPECECALECVDKINDLGGRHLVIDHYVPPYLHRIRQRRMELFGDDCWSPQRSAAAVLTDPPSPIGHAFVDDQSHPEDGIIPVNRKCYAPMWLGGEDLQNEYALTPLQLAPSFASSALQSSTRLEDHTDTRSGVCGIQFDWTPSSASSAERCMVCRGTDGYDYDEFECGDPTSVIPAAVSSFNDDDDLDGDQDVRADVNSAALLPSLYFLPLDQWTPLGGGSDCTAAPVIKRGRVTLPQCQYLAWSGHYTLLKWTQHEPLARPALLLLLQQQQKQQQQQQQQKHGADLWGDCYVYDQYQCHRRTVSESEVLSDESATADSTMDFGLFFLPTRAEPSPPALESSERVGSVRVIGSRSAEALSAAWLLSKDLFRLVILVLVVFIVVKLVSALLHRSTTPLPIPRGRSRTDSFTQGGRPGSKRFALRKLVCKLFRDYHPINSNFSV